MATTFGRYLPLGPAANDLRALVLERYKCLEGHVQFFHDRQTLLFCMKPLGRYQMDQDVFEGVRNLFNEFDAKPYIEASGVATATPAWWLATRKKYARRG